MSMIGEYARLTPAELDRAVREPGWVQKFIEELAEGTPERCLDVDKAWDSLGFLLRRIDFPVDIVYGGETVPGAEEWGYGPIRYLTAEQVRTAAAALAVTPSEALVRDVLVAELAEANLYPRIAKDDELWLTYVVDNYEGLIPFFQAAARDGDAMLVWLD